MNKTKKGNRYTGPVEPSEFCWGKGILRYVRKHAGLGIKEMACGYYPDGKIMFEYPMHMRQLNGVGRMFYHNGMKKKEEPYRQGRLDGVVSFWDEHGQLRKRETYVLGSRHGLSVEWNDSGKFVQQELFLRGRDVPEGLNQWIARTPINAEHVIGVKNIEVRRIFLQELGYERLLAGVEYKILHQDGTQALVRIDLSDREESIVLVKVKCPSTGAFYVLRVPQEMRTVREAVAWTFGLGEAEYHPLMES